MNTIEIFRMLMLSLIFTRKYCQHQINSHFTNVNVCQKSDQYCIVILIKQPSMKIDTKHSKKCRTYWQHYTEKNLSAVSKLTIFLLCPKFFIKYLRFPQCLWKLRRFKRPSHVEMIFVKKLRLLIGYHSCLSLRLLVHPCLRLL